MTTVQVVPRATELPVAQLTFDSDVQCRESIQMGVVAEYKESLASGVTFPPLVVFFDGKTNWVADGFHRGHAYRETGTVTCPCDVRQGTKRDAILYACGANASHGLKRTDKDKRRAVLTLLKDSEWSKWANTEIARRSGVSEGTVRNIKQELSSQITKIEPTQDEPRKAIRNGKEYEINTSNIGKTKTEKPEVAKPEPPREPPVSVGLVGISDDDGEEDASQEDDAECLNTPDQIEARENIEMGDVFRSFKRALLDCWARCPESRRERFKRMAVFEVGELK